MYKRQLQHRGGRIDLPHATAETAPGIASPLHFSATPIEYRSAPPTLGQHTSEVLQEVLGLSDAEIGDLASRDIL